MDNRARAFRATLIKLGAFTVVMVLVFVALVVVFSRYRSGASNEYSAVFTSASAMQSGSKVKIAGVEVGSVGGVELNRDNDAVITFSVDQQYPLPESVRALIRYENLTGDRYLELQQGTGDTSTFLADGALLPRRSGVSDDPLDGGVPLQAPDSMAATVELPHAGTVRGTVVEAGVNVIVGGGYHGKSTLLEAIAQGVYAHIPGDGRELVATDPTATKVSAADGRAVTGVDISPFITHLPGGAEVAQSAIGQRDVTMTALQAAVMAATVANDGLRMNPYLVRRVLRPDLTEVAATRPRKLNEAVTPEEAATLADLMYGSERATFGYDGNGFASKTGTAEHAEGADPHVWYVAFDKQKDVAVAVVVKNGGNLGAGATGGQVSAPIGRAVLYAAPAGEPNAPEVN